MPEELLYLVDYTSIFLFLSSNPISSRHRSKRKGKAFLEGGQTALRPFLSGGGSRTQLSLPLSPNGSGR